MNKPLVICDGRTLSEKGWSRHCGLFGTRVIVHHEGEPVFLNPKHFTHLPTAFTEQQKWCYISRQMPDEPILLKIYDSEVRDGDANYAPHTGCDINGEESLEPRQSIEVRLVVVYKA